MLRQRRRLFLMIAGAVAMLFAFILYSPEPAEAAMAYCDVTCDDGSGGGSGGPCTLVYPVSRYCNLCSDWSLEWFKILAPPKYEGMWVTWERCGTVMRQAIWDGKSCGQC